MSSKSTRPTPRPRVRRGGPTLEEERQVEVESVYSTPWSTDRLEGRRRVSSVSSSTSSLSTSSCSSSPSPLSSPSADTSPEQFWAKYKRTGGSSDIKRIRNLFAALTVSVENNSNGMTAEAVAEEEPLYSEIYTGVGGKPLRHPPLPRKNSISKPPARPPYPASAVVKNVK